MNQPVTRPFEALAPISDRILLLEHDIFLPFCFIDESSSDSTGAENETAEV